MELTIPAAIAGAAGRFGDGPALAEPEGPRISYHELLRRTTTVARSLMAVGVAPGDRVAIWSPNTHHWVLGAFGALSAGATLVPVSTRFTGPEALDAISRSGASVLIVADRFLGTDRLAALRTAAAAKAAEAAPARARAGHDTARRQVPDVRRRLHPHTRTSRYGARPQALKDALATWHARYDYYNLEETPATASAVLPPTSYHRLQEIKATYDPPAR